MGFGVAFSSPASWSLGSDLLKGCPEWRRQRFGEDVGEGDWPNCDTDGASASKIDSKILFKHLKTSENISKHCLSETFNTRLILVIAVHAALPLQALSEGGLHTPKGGLATG